jgi:hypothetical protein
MPLYSVRIKRSTKEARICVLEAIPNLCLWQRAPKSCFVFLFKSEIVICGFDPEVETYPKTPEVGLERRPYSPF